MLPRAKPAGAAKAAPVVPFEHHEQVAFVSWFRFQYPKVLIHSTPNGASLSGTKALRAAQMARLKAEGLVPGMPDLHVPEWRLWIEMKRADGGRLSKEQIACIEYLRGIGHVVIVCAGAEAARAEVKRLVASAVVRT